MRLLYAVGWPFEEEIGLPMAESLSSQFTSIHSSRLMRLNHGGVPNVRTRWIGTARYRSQGDSVSIRRAFFSSGHQEAEAFMAVVALPTLGKPAPISMEDRANIAGHLKGIFQLVNQTREIDQQRVRHFYAYLSGRFPDHFVWGLSDLQNVLLAYLRWVGIRPPRPGDGPLIDLLSQRLVIRKHASRWTLTDVSARPSRLEDNPVFIRELSLLGHTSIKEARHGRERGPKYTDFRRETSSSARGKHRVRLRG